jgi:hypothetical protein
MSIDARLNWSISLQWIVDKLDNETYIMENHHYKQSYAHCIIGCDFVRSVRNREATEWNIELESNGRYKYGEK